MNETSPTNAEISDQISALQRQVFTLLLALVVISGTLVAFLYYQSRQLGKNIASMRQITQVYRQAQPAIQGFVGQLAVYGVTHPDFQPILNKYGIAPTNATGPAVAPKK
jgi:asparagine N-glycosylation enzyme membrane subunit Stt3